MKFSRRDFALLTAVLMLLLIVATGVRFYQLAQQSLWSDEGNSAALAGRTLAQISRDAAADIHPPLYYWMLHLWAGVAGTSEWGLRSFSALLGVLLVLATAELARQWHGEFAGLAAALLAALSPFQVYYSQEARMYVLLALWAVLLMLVFWHYVRAEEQALAANRARSLPGWRGLLLGLVAAAGLYTHYVFPLMIALVAGLYVLWLLSTRRAGMPARRLLAFALSLGVALLLYLPWAGVAIRQLSSWPSTGPAERGLAAIQSAIAMLLYGPAASLSVQPLVIALAGIVALVGAIPWRWVASRVPRARPNRSIYWMRWLAPLLWAFGPLLMMLAFGLFKDAYMKFLLLASPAWVILLARGLTAPTHALRAILPDPPPGRPAFLAPAVMFGSAWFVAGGLAVALASGAALARAFEDPTVARDDYRGIADFITATAGSADAILLHAPGQSEVFDYYYHGPLPIFALPRQRPLDVTQTERDLDQLVSYRKVYALYWATAEADPDGLIERWMNTRGYKTLDQWQGNVRLVVYVMPEQRPPDESVDGIRMQFGEQIALTAYRSWNLQPMAGEVTQLQLEWQASSRPVRRYKTFLQLLDEHDHVIAQRDAEPAGESNPTDRWQAGEVVTDNHGLLIPPGTPPGTYRRIVGMYDRETMERLRQPNGEDHLDLPRVTVRRAAKPPSLAALEMQHTQRFEFGAITLLGHDAYKRDYRYAPQTPLYPGDRLHLTFYWQAQIKPRADWWLLATLNDGSGNPVAQIEGPIAGEQYSTTAWEAGDIVRGEHDLLLPAGLSPAEYRLTLTLYPDTNTSAGSANLGTIPVTAPRLTRVIGVTSRPA